MSNAVRTALLIAAFASGVFVGWQSTADCYRPGGVKDTVTLR